VAQFWTLSIWLSQVVQEEAKVVVAVVVQVDY
jgi:hypothetical protein